MTLNNALPIFLSQLQKYYSAAEAKAILENLLAEIFNSYHPLHKYEPNKSLTVAALEQINTWISALQQGQPLQYVLGKAYFYKYSFKVNQQVLIPRPETELLTDIVIKTIQANNNLNKIVDFGTGSGCIPISIKKELPNCNVIGVDISLEALKVAKENAVINNVNTVFEKYDILNNHPKWDTKMDVLVSNPPYIPISELHQMEKHVLDFEPHLALFTPNDNAYQFYEKLIDLAKNWLNANGYLFFETHYNGAQHVAQLCLNNGFEQVLVLKDTNGHERFVQARQLA
jgi:release factor glutamine methyltransferase